MTRTEQRRLRALEAEAELMRKRLAALALLVARLAGGERLLDGLADERVRE